MDPSARTAAAVKSGAQIIEKHFSISRDLWGSDHKVSMTPDEFKEMVSYIRLGKYKQIDVSPWYGSKEKELDGVNNKFRPYFNKTLVAADTLLKGTVLSEEMVFAMRPRKYSEGLPSHRFYDVMGRRIKRDLKKYDPISEDILE